jgi:hypothetical protein
MKRHDSNKQSDFEQHSSSRLVDGISIRTNSGCYDRHPLYSTTAQQWLGDVGNLRGLKAHIYPIYRYY